MKFSLFLCLFVAMLAGCQSPSTTAGRAELGTVRGNLVDIHSHLTAPTVTPADIKSADDDATSSIPLVDTVMKNLTALEGFYAEWKDAKLGPWTWTRIHWAIGIVVVLSIGAVFLELASSGVMGPALSGGALLIGHFLTGGIVLIYKGVKKLSVVAAKLIGKASSAVGSKAAPLLAKLAPTPPASTASAPSAPSAA